MIPYSSRLIVALWAIAIIVSGLGHTNWSGPLASVWPSLVLVLAGLATLGTQNASPTTRRAVVRLSVLALTISWAFVMPAVPNHRWVLVATGLTILLGSYQTSPIDLVNPRAIFSLRWILVVVYFFAALAKINSDYFNPEISCAWIFSSETLKLHGMQASSGSILTALLSVLVEALLPIVLVCSRTRWLGVVVGVIFHIGLSLHFLKYFGNFSAAMFVLLVSWLPEESCKFLYQELTERWTRTKRLWIASIIALVALEWFDQLSPSTYVILRHFIYLSFAGYLLLLVCKSSPLTPSRDAISKRAIGTPYLIIVVIMLVNGLSPYLGLKTRSALSMYSNLRMEPEYSNHLFMPKSPDLFGFFSDKVEIVETTDPALASRIKNETPNFTYLSLCSYMACQDDLCSPGHYLREVVYRRAGTVYRHQPSAPLPSDCPSWILRKIIFIGPLGPNSERTCNW